MKGRVVLRIVEAKGTVLPGGPSVEDPAGLYIRDYNPHYRFPIGMVTFTDDPYKAQSFASAIEALRFWKQEVGNTPRADGKPNRPLTAFTVEVERLP